MGIVKREKFADLPWSYTEEKPYPLMFWPWSHEDDVIDAHMAAVTVPDSQLFQGRADDEVASFLLAAPSTRFKEPTKELLIRHYGEDVVKEIRGHLPEGNDSVFELDKAAEVALGWKPLLAKCKDAADLIKERQCKKEFCRWTDARSRNSTKRFKRSDEMLMTRNASLRNLEYS